MAESEKHINALELTAAYFALKAFTKDNSDMHVHLRVDNRATQAQINKMGGPRSQGLLEITKEIWHYCLSRNITITAEYLPGALNVEADYQSRVFMDSSNWKLKHQVVSQIENNLGTCSVRGSVCGSAEHAKTRLCELETRSSCNDSRCIQSVMERSERICVSTFLHDREVSGQDSEGPGHIGVDHTDMADTNVVSKIIGNGSGGSNIATSISGSADEPIGRQSPSHRDKTTDVGGMEGLRDRLIARGLSEDSSALFLQSRRPGTQSAYKGPWTKWVSWCGKGKINAIQASVADEQSVHLSDFSLNRSGSESEVDFSEGDSHPKRLKRKATDSTHGVSRDLVSSNSEVPSSSDQDSDFEPEHSVAKRVKLDMTGRFDPLAKTKKFAWQLNEGQNEFVTKYFSKWLGETVIQDSILEECPIPDHSLLKPAKLDSDMIELLPMVARTPTRQIDSGFHRAQSKLSQVMAPLGKLWSQLEDISDRGTGKCKVEELIGLVEQSVLLIGQSQVAMEHNRHLNLFMRDPKKASELLKRNEGVLERSDGRSDLFGATFYKALYKRAKGHKHSAEIKRELTSQFKPKIRTPGHSRGNHHGFTKKPFQGGSTQNQHFRTQRGANHGGNQSRGRGQRTRGFGKPKTGYVYLFSNKTSHIRQGSCPTYKLHYSRPNAGKNSPRAQTAKVDNVRLPRSGGGSVRFLPKKLGKNNKRSMDLAARQGDKSRADQPSHTDSGTVLPQILKNGNQSTIPRSGRVVKQGGSGEDSSLTRSVSGTPLPSSKKRRVIQTGVQHERTKTNLYSTRSSRWRAYQCCVRYWRETIG